MKSPKSTAAAAPAKAPQASETITFTPHPEKPETKNCYQFEEQPANGMPPKIGVLYVQKWVFGGKAPAKLVLTLETAA